MAACLAAPVGPARHGGTGGPGPAAVGATSLHGEFVVPDGAGGYTTVLTQTGTVTAISPTSITVRSEDGFSQTYVIPSTAGNAGAPPFAVDDQVVVRATRNGQTATVTNIGNPQQSDPRPRWTRRAAAPELALIAPLPKPSGVEAVTVGRGYGRRHPAKAPSSTWWFRRS